MTTPIMPRLFFFINISSFRTHTKSIRILVEVIHFRYKFKAKEEVCQMPQ